MKNNEIQYDLSCISSHAGIESSKFMQKKVKKYKILKNVLILKYILSAKKLNLSYKGGLNSFSLVILFIAYIKYN